MKKYIAFMATAALMLAACAKEEAQPTVGGETETITVVLGADTKATLDGIKASWEKGDKVSVYLGTEDLGDLECTDAATGTFSGELNSAGKNGDVVLNYPADATTVPTNQTATAGSFDKKGLILKGETTLANLRAGEGASLANQAALLQFSVAQAGDVTFEVGTTKYTVTGCQTSKTYYACIAPVTAKLTARIDGYLSKATSASKPFAANKVYDLTNLPEPEYCKYGLIGAHQNWTWGNLTKLYKVNDNLYAVKGITLKADGFKFGKMTANGWGGDPSTDSNSYGVHGTSNGVNYYKYDTENKGKWYEYWTNNDIANKKQNIGVSDFTKKYDIYLYFEDKINNGGYQHFKFTVVEAGGQMPS